MIGSLPLFHRVSGKRVVVVGDGAMADAKRRLVTRAGAIPCPETEAHHAQFAFVALEDGSEAEAAATRLRRAGLLVNVADRPDLCDFTTPSILDREPVLVAIGTSGASAGLAKQLRLRLEGLLPQNLGRLASDLGAARERLRARFPAMDDRRRALDDALTAGGALDPLVDHGEDAVGSWLDDAPESAPSRIETIELGSADPDDLTLRQARWLGEADTILVDGPIPEAILARARADADRIPFSADMKPREGLTVILRNAR